ncbi:MAG: hypothetical protein ACLGSD_02080 [Acidobacteriota bacterium]
MNRPILAIVFAACTAAALSAQQSQQQTAPDPYQGVSHPPANDVITTAPPEPLPKPAAGKPMVTPAPAPAPATQKPAPQPAPEVRPAPAPAMATDAEGDGTDDGIVEVAPDPQNAAPAQPTLNKRSVASDPDGDIVHVGPVGPNTLESGTMIRARLLTQLSTADNQRGDKWRARVASDVVQDGQVLIPAGSEIDGRVVEISEGHAGGHGSMRLRPDTVILEDGSRYRLDAQVVGTPGTNTNVSGEGVINAGSRWKKDGIEYGGAVGAGAATGAIVAGPLGAATGSLVGAGLITVHLLVDHPQATLEQGTVLLFTLNSRLSLSPATRAGD